jgi:uncharacterized protein YkwD
VVFPRTAIVTAALAVCAFVPAGASAAASAAPAATTAATAQTAKHQKARATRRFTACTSSHHRRMSPRARRACLAHRRKLRGHKPPAPAKAPAATNVSAATLPATSAQTPAPAPAPVASTAPCADGDLTPDPTNLARVNAATLCLVNQIRGQHGLGELTINAKLQAAAQRHTDDMVAQSYFAHVGPAGDDPLSRMTDAGYVSDSTPSYSLGENIAWGTLTLSTPASIVNAWVNSPEHLANILDAAYRDTGMAASSSAPPTLAQGQQGSVYTQDFGGLGN